MMTAAAMLSMRNLPAQAEVGLQMITLGLLAAVFSLLPTALVAAELGTGWSKLGGVYVWVREAFGERWGFIAIWLQWMQSAFLMVAVLLFIGGTLAYMMGDVALNQNKWFLMGVLLTIYWLFTFLNMRGLKASGIISTTGFVVGVLVPGVLIIILGAVYLIQGNPSQLDLSFTAANLIPDFTHISGLTLLSAFVLTFTGIEISAANLNQVRNVKRNYPFILLAIVVVALVMNLAGSMAVGVVVPAKHLSLDAGLAQAFQMFFDVFHIGWITPIIAACIAGGAIGEVSTYLISPVKGILATADNGDIPPFFQKVNKEGVPTRLLITQAFIVSIFAVGFLLVPSINLAFWLFAALDVLVHLVMYIIMYLACIRLRYSEPDVPRPFKIPGGKIGVWLVAGIGTIASLYALVLAFVAPAQLPDIDFVVYEVVISTLFVVSIASGFIVYALRKPDWKRVAADNLKESPHYEEEASNAT